MPSPESSRNILVVEDEWLIALDITMLIEEQGHTVIGPARNVAEATALIEANPIDAAFLDIWLGSEKSFPSQKSWIGSTCRSRLRAPIPRKIFPRSFKILTCCQSRYPPPACAGCSNECLARTDLRCRKRRCADGSDGGTDKKVETPKIWRAPRPSTKLARPERPRLFAHPALACAVRVPGGSGG